MHSVSPTHFIAPSLGPEKEKDLIHTALAPAPRRKTSSSRIIRPSTAPPSIATSSPNPSNVSSSLQSAPGSNLSSSDSLQPTSLLFQPTSNTVNNTRPSSAIELNRDEAKMDQKSEGQAAEQEDKVAVDTNGPDLQTEDREGKVEKVEKVEKVKEPSPWTLPIGGHRKKPSAPESLAPAPVSLNGDASPASVHSNLTDDDPVEAAQVVQVIRKPSLLSARSPTAPSSLSKGLKSPLRRLSSTDSAQNLNARGGRSPGPPTPPPKSPRHMLKLHPVFDSTIPLPTRPATSPRDRSGSAPALESSIASGRQDSTSSTSASTQPMSIPSVNVSSFRTPPTESTIKFHQTSVSVDSALTAAAAPLSPKSPVGSLLSLSSSSSSSTHRVKRKPVPFDMSNGESMAARRHSTQSYDGPGSEPLAREGKAPSFATEGKSGSTHQRSPSGSDVMKAAQEAALAHIAARKANGGSPAAQLAVLPSSSSHSAHRHSFSEVAPQTTSSTRQVDAISTVQKDSQSQRPRTSPGLSTASPQVVSSKVGKKKKASVLMIEGQTFLLDIHSAKEKAAALTRNSQDSKLTADSVNEDDKELESAEEEEEGEGDEEEEEEDEEGETDGLEEQERERGRLESFKMEARFSSSEDAALANEKQAQGNRSRSDTFNSSATSTTGSHRSPWSSLNKVKENLLKENDSSSFSTAPPTHSERQSEQIEREEEDLNHHKYLEYNAGSSSTSHPTSTARDASTGHSSNSFRTAPGDVSSENQNFDASIQSALEPEFEAEDVIYDFSEGGTRDAPPPGSYAIHPPTIDQLIQASNCVIYDEDANPIQFGQVFREGRTLVCFLRHWWCGFCQEFAMSLAAIDMLPLQRAGLGLVVIGQGSPHVTAAYKQVMNVPFPMYADPERNVYKALGMTLRTNDAGPACAVPDYVQSGMTKSIVVAIKRGLFDMPIRAPGDMKLLGGEFILGPGLQCSFTHRMVTTRGHLDLPRILAQAGCDMSLKSPRAVGDESISSRPESTRSLGRSRSRLLRRKKERQNKGRDSFADASENVNNELEKAVSVHSDKAKTRRTGKQNEHRERQSSEISGTVPGDRSASLPFRRNKGLFAKLAIGNTSQTSLASQSIRSAATELYNPPPIRDQFTLNFDSSQSSSHAREAAPRRSLSLSVDEEKKSKSKSFKSKMMKAKSSVDLGGSNSPKTGLSSRFPTLTSSSRRSQPSSPRADSLEPNGLGAKDVSSHNEPVSQRNSMLFQNRDIKDEVFHITKLRPRPKSRNSSSEVNSEGNHEAVSRSVSTSSPVPSQSNDSHSTPRPNKLQHAFLDTDPSEMKGFRTPKPEEWNESKNHTLTTTSTNSSPQDRTATSEEEDAQAIMEMDQAEKEYQESLRKKVREAAGITEDLDVDSLIARRDRFMRENDIDDSTGGAFGGFFLDGLDAFDALPGTRTREERYLDEMEMESTIQEEDESFLEDDDEEEEEEEEPEGREEPQRTLRSTPSKSSYPSTDDTFSDATYSDHEDDDLPTRHKSKSSNEWDSQTYSPDSESFDSRDPQVIDKNLSSYSSSKHARSSSSGSSTSVLSAASSSGVASSSLHGSNWRPLDPNPRPSILESVQNRRLSAFDEKEEEEADLTSDEKDQDERESDVHSYYERNFSIDSQRSQIDSNWRDGNQSLNGHARRRSTDSFEEARTPLAKVNELPTEALWA